MSRITIVTTMKNEGAFILEWIAYNRVIGFTDFVVFTNDCEDGTDLIIERLEELGIASHVPNRLKPGQSPQRKALRRSWTHPKVESADWLMSADVDEFLNIRVGDGTVPELLEKVGDADAISLCWKLFGNSGQTEFRRGFVTEQFVNAAPEYRYPDFRARGVKTLFRRSEPFSRFGVHRPRVDPEARRPVWLDAGGRPMPDDFIERGWSARRGFRHDWARLHHYAVRSVDSFLVKRDRGRTNHVNVDQGLVYWQAMNANQKEDRSILDRLPPVREEYDRLLSDPELARLHEAACLWHESKIAELHAREGWDDFRERISAIEGRSMPARRPLAVAEHAAS